MMKQITGACSISTHEPEIEGYTQNVRELFPELRKEIIVLDHKLSRK
ncbi:hypothetical protein [Chryseobacterium piperi]|nr:hypothetical protein [Chryseobacterium piperi]